MHNFYFGCMLSKLLKSGKDKYVGFFTNLMNGYLGPILCNCLKLEIPYIGYTRCGPRVNFCNGCENLKNNILSILAYLDFNIQDLFLKKCRGGCIKCWYLQDEVFVL